MSHGPVLYQARVRKTRYSDFVENTTDGQRDVVECVSTVIVRINLIATRAIVYECTHSSQCTSFHDDNHSWSRSIPAVIAQRICVTRADL